MGPGCCDFRLVNVSAHVMKQNILIGTVVLLVLPVLIVPFALVQNDIVKSLKLTADLLTALAALIALLIAVCAYNKYVLDQPILKKQSDVVLS